MKYNYFDFESHYNFTILPLIYQKYKLFLFFLQLFTNLMWNIKGITFEHLILHRDRIKWYILAKEWII